VLLREAIVLVYKVAPLAPALGVLLVMPAIVQVGALRLPRRLNFLTELFSEMFLRLSSGELRLIL
jgi:hypothetical protein